MSNDTNIPTERLSDRQVLLGCGHGWTRHYTAKESSFIPCLGCSGRHVRVMAVYVPPVPAEPRKR